MKKHNLLGRVNLTAGRISNCTLPAGTEQAFLWDSDIKQLAVRVTAGKSGKKKAYIFQSRFNGKSLRITIGAIEAWSIDRAREEARRLQTLIDQGRDPRLVTAAAIASAEEVRAKEIAASRRRVLLVSEAWGAYIAYQKDKMQQAHIERGKRWGARHLADHENLAQAGGEKKKRGSGLTRPGVLYPVLQLRMAEISSDVLKDWQRQEAETRANNARQGFEMFRAFWRWCGTRLEFKEIVDADAVEGKELRDRVPSRKSKKFDVLQKSHVKAWFSAVRGLSNPVASAYLQALVLTGARREEIAEMTWDDIDFKWGSFWIKDKVDEEGRMVPLTPYMRDVLLNLKRINETPPPSHRILHGKRIENDIKNWKPSPWVFFSKSAKSGRIAEPRSAHNRALTIAGIPHVSIHGLRRTFKSLAEWVEIPAGVVSQITGHKPSATEEKHYITRPLELLAIWHCRYEAWILEQAGVEFEHVQTGPKLVDIA
jgi:integrase